MPQSKQPKYERRNGVRLASSLIQDQQPGEELEDARRLPLSLIDHTPYFQRDAVNVDDLALSMSSEGQLQPIIVRPTADGRYQAVGGNRRLTAARQLGWQDIAATIRELDDKEAAIATAVENFQREDLTLAEEARMYKYLIAIFAIPEYGAGARLAEMLHRDNNRILRLLKIAEHGDLLELADRGSYTFVDAYNEARHREQATKTAKAQPQESHREILPSAGASPAPRPQESHGEILPSAGASPAPRPQESHREILPSIELASAERPQDLQPDFPSDRGSAPRTEPEESHREILSGAATAPVSSQSRATTESDPARRLEAYYRPLRSVGRLGQQTADVTVIPSDIRDAYQVAVQTAIFELQALSERLEAARLREQAGGV